jgi:hypothetical protein
VQKNRLRQDKPSCSRRNKKKNSNMSAVLRAARLPPQDLLPRANPSVAGLVRMDDFVTDEREAAREVRSILHLFRQRGTDWSEWARGRSLLGHATGGDMASQP